MQQPEYEACKHPQGGGEGRANPGLHLNPLGSIRNTDARSVPDHQSQNLGFGEKRLSWVRVPFHSDVQPEL